MIPVHAAAAENIKLVAVNLHKSTEIFVTGWLKHFRRPVSILFLLKLFEQEKAVATD